MNGSARRHVAGGGQEGVLQLARDPPDVEHPVAPLARAPGRSRRRPGRGRTGSSPGWRHRAATPAGPATSGAGSRHRSHSQDSSSDVPLTDAPALRRSRPSTVDRGSRQSVVEVDLSPRSPSGCAGWRGSRPAPAGARTGGRRHRLQIAGTDRLAELLALVVLHEQHAVDVAVHGQGPDDVVRRASETVAAEPLQRLVLTARHPGRPVAVPPEPRSEELADDPRRRGAALVAVDLVRAR